MPANKASEHAVPAVPTLMPQAAAKAPAPLERVRQVAADMEKFIRESRRNVQFEVDDAAGVVVVRVIDATSGDVIRQIPSEEFLRLARGVSEHTPSVNLLVDDKA
jgi:flagellar protein FlaG